MILTAIICMRKQQHRYQVYSAGQTVPSRAEGNNTKCVGKKRFNGSVTHGFGKSMCYVHFGKFVP
jgi:hypothetical protein